MDKSEEEIWKEMNDSTDEYIIHFKGVVDNKECTKRKLLRVLSCPICSYLFALKYLSNKNKFQGIKNIYQELEVYVNAFQDFYNIYQPDQELEKYIEENKEHIIKHSLIRI